MLTGSFFYLYKYLRKTGENSHEGWFPSWMSSGMLLLRLFNRISWKSNATTVSTRKMASLTLHNNRCSCTCGQDDSRTRTEEDGCTALVMATMLNKTPVAKILIAAYVERGVGVDHRTVRATIFNKSAIEILIWLCVDQPINQHPSINLSIHQPMNKYQSTEQYNNQTVIT